MVSDLAAVAPQNLEAEESVLGAMLLSAKAIEAVSAILDDGGAFYRESHARIYRAAVDLHARGEPVDTITLAAELERRDGLREIPGGHIRINELAALVPAASNAAHYAQIVRDKATARALLREIEPLVEQAKNGGLDHADAAAAIARATEILADAPSIEATSRRLLSGDEFVLDRPTEITAVWGGASGTVAWAVGEPTMLVGPDGVGKTTLGQQLALGRVGLRDRVIGMRVVGDERPVLYLAMDRPAQAARSLARMVTEADRDVLRDRLLVWKGPLSFSVFERPQALAEFTIRAGAGTLVVDSLKDLAPKLSDDEVGGRVNLAFQELVSRGVEVLVLHHQRKAQQNAGPPKRLADVYGSRWLTAGMGSVFCLWGEPGDPVVEFLHLKQPSDEIGPWKVLHDHDRGSTSIVEQVNLLELVGAAGAGALTAETAALAMFGAASRNEVEKARRRLEKLVGGGLIDRHGEKPNPVTYRPKESA